MCGMVIKVGHRFLRYLPARQESCSPGDADKLGETGEKYKGSMCKATKDKHRRHARGTHGYTKEPRDLKQSRKFLQKARPRTEEGRREGSRREGRREKRR